MAAVPPDPPPSLRRLLAPLGPPLRANLGLLLATVVAGWGKFLIPMTVPAITRHVLDHLVDLPRSALARPLVLVSSFAAVVILVTAVASYYRSTLAGWLTSRIRHHLRTRLFHHMQFLSMTFFERHRAGSLGTRVGGDINSATVVVDRGLVQISMDTVQTTVAVLLMLGIDPWLTLVSAILVLAQVVLVRLFGPLLRNRSRSIQEQQSLATGQAAEIFAGISVVKAFAGEAQSGLSFADSSGRLRDLEGERAHLSGLFQALSYGLVLLSQVGVVFLGAVLIAWSGDGAITKGGLIAFLLYLGFLSGSVQRLADSLVEIQEGLAALGRIDDVLRVMPAPADRPDAIAPPITGAVTCHDVSFAYAPGGPAALDGFTYRFAPGLTYALVGPSGSGKSTLVRLLLRFDDPGRGRIELDGVDLTRIRQAHLRQHLSVVLQDPIIFSGSVWDNIAFGKPDATATEVEAAARLAQAHDFISALEDGYLTPLGERGASLSGGQRQRIALARSLLRDPRILILDEATSALDTSTERSIQTVLDHLRGSRTLIVIAHRLSTVRNADRILVLSAGRLVEDGTWDDLAARDGAFARLLHDAANQELTA